jgi:peptide-methionine (S)-S-oxide reductase
MLEFLTGRKHKMPSSDEALPGRGTPIAAPGDHAVLGTPMAPPFPDDTEQVVVGMGCFWGAERAFWTLPGVYTTAVGYGAGITPNPTYEEVCSGRTGHNEVVLAVYHPAELSFDEILRSFWEGHDPTQGMRQGNDAGTQYRSGLYTTSDSQQRGALASRDRYAEALSEAGRGGEITTEILPAGEFYYAEQYHQQYLYKNPGGYCGLGGTGVSCPVGLNASA